MLVVVDRCTVPDGHLAEYLELLRSDVRPRMVAAGATLEYCRRTFAGVGEPVEVEIAWSFADLPAWNDIRRRLVLDPGYYACAEALASLRTAGTRRFLTPLDLAAGDAP